MIIPTAGPFLFTPTDQNSEIGILLVHGFTGTPREMLEMGQSLSQAGFIVLAPRLAGHATQIEDLDRVHWQDWLHSVEDGYYILKHLSKKIFIAGLSMGGVLSILFASRYQIDGLITMSTPFELPPDPRLKFLPYLPYLSPFLKRIPKGESDWVDPLSAEGHVDYPAYPTRAILQVRSLISEMQIALPQVSIPTLLIHSLRDGSVPYTHMDKIARYLGTKDKKTITVKNSGHVIIRDQERDLVFNEVISFINHVCGSIN
jgi:carboxylesterase